MVGVVVLVVLAGGAIVAFLLLRESTTAVDVDEAVGDFRRQQQSTAPATTEAAGVETTAAASTTSTPPRPRRVPAPGSGVPEPGVYTYATTGRESIDALGGRSHRYPEVSTITVTHERCGAVSRWRPLRERWDAMSVCPSARGQELRVDRNHHEFFGIGDTREFVCEPGALFFPATTAPGTTWTDRCSTDDVDVVRTGTILGTSQVVVGGTPVTVLGFEMHEAISGASTGTTERTVRVVPDTGLVVELAAGRRRAQRQPARGRPLHGAVPDPAHVARPAPLAAGAQPRLQAAMIWSHALAVRLRPWRRHR